MANTFWRYTAKNGEVLESPSREQLLDDIAAYLGPKCPHPSKVTIEQAEPAPLPRPDAETMLFAAYTDYMVSHGLDIGQSPYGQRMDPQVTMWFQEQLDQLTIRLHRKLGFRDARDFLKDSHVPATPVRRVLGQEEITLP